MIDKLTASQEALLKEYRDKVFGYATSTVTDKPKAEAAARRLVSVVIPINPEVHWVKSLAESHEMYCLHIDSFGSSLPLKSYLRSSLSDSLWNQIHIRHHFSNSLSRSLNEHLTGYLCKSLDDLLFDSLYGSTKRQLYESLKTSIFNTAWHSGQVSLYAFTKMTLLVNYDHEISRMFECCQELLESCFAMYSLPGHIILLEKPKRVKVDDGKLIEIEW